MKITKTKAKQIGDKLGVDWNKYNVEEFKMGLEVEQEHKDVTGGDLLTTGKIALAHMEEFPDYYSEFVLWEKYMKGR